MRSTFFPALSTLCAVLLVASCKSNDVAATSTTTTIGQQCNAGSASDGGAGSGGCSAGSVCSVNYCRTPCATDATCPAGTKCLSGPGGNGCQLESAHETMCSTASPCTTPGLVCGGDMTCRNFCNANTPCLVAGDTCMDGACVGAGGSASDGGGGDGGAPDASMTAQDAGGGSRDATMQSRDASAGAPGGTGIGSNPCPAGQEQFGFVAQGDSNPNYTSGVGVRTATQLLIFDAYVGAPAAGLDASVGDAGTANLVYVQAFDPVTAMSLGPPTFLFQAPDGAGFGIEDISIAPTGQIAVALGYGPHWDVYGVYAAFLSPSSSDGGSGGLAIGPITQLDTSRVWAQPYVVWSSVNQAFVFSWEDLADGVHIAQFLPDGRPASGASGLVPTPAGGVYTRFSTTSGAVGTAGHLTGVGFLSGSGNNPFLTILDATNAQVGSSVQLSTTACQWVAVGGTAQGFVTFFGCSGGAEEAFVGASDDAGVPAASADGGDAGALPTFAVPGAANVVGMRAVSDDTGGPGGVGAVVVSSTQVSFVYVNPDGLAPLAGSNVLFGHPFVATDLVTISNYRGLFAVSLYDSTKRSTQVIASGCQ